MSIGLAVVCLPWLRWKHPEWDRPIRVHWIWPLLYTLATIFITIVPMVASPVETGKYPGEAYTLESGIDVGQGITVGPGKFVKKNKRRALNKHRA